MRVRALVVHLLIIGGAGGLFAQAATAETYSFTHIVEPGDDANQLANGAIGEAQLFVDVTPYDTNQALFTFRNTGPQDCSIRAVYFDDGVLLQIADLIDEDDGTGGDEGVDFSQHASPVDLPAGGYLSPPFVTTDGFSADADPPTKHNGVEPGESLGIIFSLDGTYAEAIDELATGYLRIGLKVQSFPDGDSQSFVNGEPNAVDRLLTTSSSAGGSVTTPGEPGPYTYNHGELAAITATPLLGYYFVNWTGTGVDAGKVADPNSPTTTITMDADYSVHANFATNQYTLLIYTVGSGSVAIDSCSAEPNHASTHNHGDVVNLTAVAAPCWTFAGWSGDLTGTTNPNSVTIDDNKTVTATFTQDQYTVSSSAGENGSIAPAGDTVVDCNDDLPFTATPDTCYEVDTWYLDGNNVQTGGTGYTLENITANHTVSVTFKQSQLTVTSSAGENGSISPVGETVVNCADSLTFMATPDTCYEVDTWYLDGNSVQAGGAGYTLENITANHTVSVTFRQSQHAVSSSAGENGSIDPLGDTVVNCGESLTFTATPAGCYEVDTWYLDASPAQTGGTTYQLSNIQSSHTVSVTFKQSQHTVSSSAGENGSIDPVGDTVVNCGESLSFTATPDGCYEVDTWYLDASPAQTGGTTYQLSNIQSSHTVSVTFKQSQHTVSSSAGENGSIDPLGDTVVNCGESLSFTATPDGCYEVDTWYLDASPAQTGGTTYLLSNIQSSHTVSVTFKQSQHTVTSSAGENGSIDPLGDTVVNCGESLTFTAAPVACYEVDTWYLDASPVQTGGTTYLLSNIQSSHTVSVTFKQSQYTISSSAGENGSIDPLGDTVVNCGDSLSFTATPDTCYEVDTWYLDASPVQTGGTTYLLSNIQSSRTVSVTFKQSQHTVSSSAGPNGSIDPLGDTVVNCGESLTFTAAPVGCY
ncbi:MAG: InlB B-repeat-containing protein, partial [Planctomycetota bacterium]